MNSLAFPRLMDRDLLADLPDDRNMAFRGNVDDRPPRARSLQRC